MNTRYLISGLVMGLLTCCLFLNFSITAASVATSQSELIEKAQQLPQEGVLKDNGEGFVYLKVNDDYILELFPLVDEPSFQKPPYFRRPDSPGAHISVFYTDETSNLGDIKEIGQTFHFEVQDVKVVKNGRKQYFILEVKSPELEKLREKYGLNPKLQGHEFHITIASKKNKKRH